MALRGALNFGNRLNRLLRLNGRIAPIHSRSKGVKRALRTDISRRGTVSPLGEAGTGGAATPRAGPL